MTRPLRTLVVAPLVLVMMISTSVVASNKTTIMKTELGEFPTLVGKDLPEFVRRAVELVPLSSVPAGLGPLVDKIVVVTDARAFSKAMAVTSELHVMYMDMKSPSHEIFILMDSSYSSPEDPLTLVVGLQAQWQADQRKGPDRGMAHFMATLIVHELGHLRHSTLGEDLPNQDASSLLQDFARQGKVSQDLVRASRTILGQRQ